MAGVAVCRRSRKIVVHVAIDAGHGQVRAGQGECGLGAVVEDRSGPARRHRVAD